MKLLSLLIGVSLLFVGTVWANDISAKTATGQKVVLKDDGTWQYYKDSKSSSIGRPSVYTKPKDATRAFNGKGGFSVWYNPKKWLLEKSDGSRQTLKYKNEDLYAMVISERIPVSIEKLKEVALNNALKVAPDTTIVFEEDLTVNGTDVSCLRMEGNIEGIDFIYYGYYYSNEFGSHQLLTYTAKSLFNIYEANMSDFLNGFVMK